MEQDAGRTGELHALILSSSVRLAARADPEDDAPRESRSSGWRRRSTAVATRSSAPPASASRSTARIFRDGHETLGAAVRYRPAGSTRWSEAPLEPLGNDLWAGSFEVDRPGLW